MAAKQRAIPLKESNGTDSSLEGAITLKPTCPWLYEYAMLQLFYTLLSILFYMLLSAEMSLITDLQ